MVALDFMYVSVCSLIFFLKCSFLLTTFMKIIIPLKKCKSGDLADVNNYRAIAVSKLIENVLASFVQSAKDVEAY